MSTQPETSNILNDLITQGDKLDVKMATFIEWHNSTDIVFILGAHGHVPETYVHNEKFMKWNVQTNPPFVFVAVHDKIRNGMKYTYGSTFYIPVMENSQPQQVIRCGSSACDKPNCSDCYKVDIADLNANIGFRRNFPNFSKIYGSCLSTLTRFYGKVELLYVAPNKSVISCKSAIVSEVEKPAEQKRIIAQKSKTIDEIKLGEYADINEKNMKAWCADRDITFQLITENSELRNLWKFCGDNYHYDSACFTYFAHHSEFRFTGDSYKYYNYAVVLYIPIISNSIEQDVDSCVDGDCDKLNCLTCNKSNTYVDFRRKFPKYTEIKDVNTVKHIFGKVKLYSIEGRNLLRCIPQPAPVKTTNENKIGALDAIASTGATKRRCITVDTLRVGESVDVDDRTFRDHFINCNVLFQLATKENILYEKCANDFKDGYFTYYTGHSKVKKQKSSDATRFNYSAVLYLPIIENSYEQKRFTCDGTGCEELNCESCHDGINITELNKSLVYRANFPFYKTIEGSQLDQFANLFGRIKLCSTEPAAKMPAPVSEIVQKQEIINDLAIGEMIDIDEMTIRTIDELNNADFKLGTNDIYGLNYHNAKTDMFTYFAEYSVIKRTLFEVPKKNTYGVVLYVPIMANSYAQEEYDCDDEDYDDEDYEDIECDRLHCVSCYHDVDIDKLNMDTSFRVKFPKFQKIKLAQSDGLSGELSGRIKLLCISPVQPASCPQIAPVKSVMAAEEIGKINFVVQELTVPADDMPNLELIPTQCNQFRQDVDKENPPELTPKDFSKENLVGINPTKVGLTLESMTPYFRETKDAAIRYEEAKQAFEDSKRKLAKWANPATADDDIDQECSTLMKKYIELQNEKRDRIAEEAIKKKRAEIEDVEREYQALAIKRMKLENEMQHIQAYASLD
ncbi:MAG: hypothetical protein Faunusvirus14_6 [Faunusvirus sp.]|jgi:hypothetical protein|uniref:Uncharacterized protein n=1 Tax=Faunusvirus sp. TaxID=2487766 RepID=A0A3G5A1R7_9VIRU|nr:MAG: hypothetical protein Faunusvirus14_6 [Faunusvirus sp.]